MMTKAEQTEFINKAVDCTGCAREYINYLGTVVEAIEKLSSDGDNAILINDLASLGSFMANDFYSAVSAELGEFNKIRSRFKGGLS